MNGGRHNGGEQPIDGYEIGDSEDQLGFDGKGYILVPDADNTELVLQHGADVSAADPSQQISLFRGTPADPSQQISLLQGTSMESNDILSKILESGSTYPRNLKTEDDEETFIDRILALTDAFPPKLKYLVRKFTRATYSKVTKMANFFGNVTWFIATASLITVLPVALDLEREQLLIQEELQIRSHHSGSPEQKRN